MNRLFRISSLAIAILAISASAIAQSRKIKESDLPEAVKATAAQVSAGGRVAAYWEREQDGETVYEVDVVVEGRGKGVLIRPDGEVVVIQAEVPFEELDPAVQDGIKRQAGDARVVKVDSITKGERIERYVATVDQGGQKSKIEVGPDGGPPSPGTP